MHMPTLLMAIIVLLPLGSFGFVRWMKKHNHWIEHADKRNLETKTLTNLLIILNLFVIAALGMLLLSGLTQTSINVAVAVIQIMTFAVKLLMINFVFVWVRWTLPRFRYDQLQTLGWKVLMPLAIANIVVTATFIVVKGL